MDNNVKLKFYAVTINSQTYKITYRDKHLNLDLFLPEKREGEEKFINIISLPSAYLFIGDKLYVCLNHTSFYKYLIQENNNFCLHVSNHITGLFFTEPEVQDCLTAKKSSGYLKHADERWERSTVEVLNEVSACRNSNNSFGIVVVEFKKFSLMPNISNQQTLSV